MGKRIIDNQIAQANRKRPREDDGEATPRKRGRPKASSLLQRYPTLKLLDDVTIQRKIEEGVS